MAACMECLFPTRVDRQLRRLKKIFSKDDPLNVLVVGFQHHGKSSFINTVNHVIEAQKQGETTVEFAQVAGAGGHGGGHTNGVHRIPLCDSLVLYDTQGLETTWSIATLDAQIHFYLTTIQVVHCAVFVISLTELQVVVECPLRQRLLSLLHAKGIQVVIVGTHKDEADDVKGSVALMRHLLVDAVFTLECYRFQRGEEEFIGVIPETQVSIARILSQLITFGRPRINTAST